MNLNQVCMVLDLECFCIDSKQCCRELGYYTHKHRYGRVAFFMNVPYRHLSERDKRRVNYVRRYIHGLTYRPRTEEHARNLKELKDTVLDIYERCKTDCKYVVAYKGGHVERDLLRELNIPSLDLELYGCPKYEEIDYHSWLVSCGFHADPVHHHCSILECEAFWMWLLDTMYKSS